MALSTGAVAGISAAAGAVGIIIIGFIYAKYSQGFRPGTGALTVPFIIFQYFLPYFVGFYVLFSDILIGTVALSPSLIAAILGVSINWMFGGLPAGSIPVSDICGIPGLSNLYSTHLPQAPLFVSTIFGYIVTFFGVTPALSSQAFAAGMLWLAVSLVQYTTLFTNSDVCLTNFTGAFGSFGGGKLSPILSMILGGGGGAAAAYATSYIMQKYFPSSGPAASPSIPPFSPGPVVPPVSSGATPPSDVGTCSPPNDQDQFVCEAYKDGKLVTSTIAG